MKEASHSEVQEKKNPALTDIVKVELIAENGLKEEPYQFEFEAVEEDIPEFRNFNSAMEESIPTETQNCKDLLLSKMVKKEMTGDGVLNKDSCLNKFEANVEDFMEEMISENVTPQLQPVTAIKRFENSLPINSESRSDPLENNLTDRQTIEQGIIFVCSLCNDDFEGEEYFRKHLELHGEFSLPPDFYHQDQGNHKKNYKLCMLITPSNRKKYKCSNCNFECMYKSNMNRHMITHSNTKQFSCSVCDYECNRKGDLKRHLLTHSNTKQFRCTDCDYECNQKINLQRHMLMHSNINQFRCSVCDYECNRKSHLKEHMLRHFNIKLFKCSDCHYECNRKDSLKRHMLTHSKGKYENAQKKK